MVRRKNNNRPKQRRTHLAMSGTSLQAVGNWHSPPVDPPPIIDNKWRFARLKTNVAAAGDSGSLIDFTAVSVFNALKVQQGVNISSDVASVRILKVMSYALQGVADAGGQTYPSTKIRVYAPLEDSSQGVLLGQREDIGTLQSAARIGYRYPKHLQDRVLASSSTAYFCQVENYHCARGYVYIDVMWTTNPN